MKMENDLIGRAEKSLEVSPEEVVRKVSEKVARKTADQLKQEFDAVQANVDNLKSEIETQDRRVKENEKLPESIRGGSQQAKDKRTKLQNITEVVKQTILAINQPQASKIDLPVDSVSLLRNLAEEIDLWSINQNNAVFVDYIIRLGLENRLNSIANLKSTFRSIELLQYLDQGVYEKIADAFRDEARRLGAGEEDLDQLSSDWQKEQREKIGASPKTIKHKQVRDQVGQSIEEGTNIIENLDIDSLNGTDYEREINAQYSQADPASRADQIEEAKKEKIQSLKNQLRERLRNILRAEWHPDQSLDDTDFAAARRDFSIKEFDPNQMAANVREFLRLVEDLGARGVIKPSEYSRLTEIANNLKDNGRQYLEVAADDYKRRTLAAHAEDVLGELKNHEELLNALENLDLFKAYIKRKGYFRAQNDRVGWDEFCKDVRNLFETLFEVAQSQPKLFWQESFYELHEGFLYKRMVRALKTLGDAIRDDPDLRNKNVMVWDFYAYSEKLANPELDKLIPGRNLVGRNKVSVKLDEAIRSVLANQMVDLKDFTEYCHNVNVIAQVGMGFDKLAEYASKLRMRDVMRIIASTEGLSDAYNLLLENMQMELALNNHVLRPDFGELGQFNYDRVERQTAIQLCSDRGKEKIDDPEIKRLIRLASGITKGVTGEFWGTAWTASLPIGVKEVIEKIGKETVRHYEIDNIYLSLSNPGIEKMMPTLDIFFLLRRFKLPRQWVEIMAAFIPRNYEKFPKRMGISKTAWWQHGDLYEWYKEKDEAMFKGRTDKLANQDENYIFADELTKTASMDYFLRGGWRFYVYHTCLVYERKSDGKPKTDAKGKMILDFEATMRQLQGVGPYFVKTFLDDLFAEEDPVYQKDISAMTLDNLAPHVIKPGSPEEAALIKIDPKSKWKVGEEIYKLSDKQKNLLQEIFYDEYIFQPLAAKRPSHFIVMEDRRWMPRDEVTKGHTLRDRLLDRLVEIYKERYDDTYIREYVLPLYTGALELAEKTVWDKHKKEWKKNREDGIYWPDHDPLNYIFNESSFEGKFFKDDLHDRLINYFKLQKQHIGLIPDPGRKDLIIDDEEFIAHLKDFTKTLISAIREERWDRVKHTDENKITLTMRYAKFLRKSMGKVEYYLKGNLLDLNEIYLHQAGSRTSERFFGESAAIAKDMTDTLKHMFINCYPALVKNIYGSDEQFEKAVEQIFGQPFKKIFDAIAIIDATQAHGFCKNWITMSAELLQLDRIWRIAGGSAALNWFRRYNGTQGSYFTDKIPQTVREPATALTSPRAEIFVRTCAKAIDLPREGRVKKAYKPLKIFGKSIPFLKIIPEHEKHEAKHHIEQIINFLGLQRGLQITEASPAILIILPIILLLLAKLALDKGKKR
jgi:hypothetical protein